MAEPTPYGAILDAGDRLEAALLAGDLGRAEDLLAERARLIERVSGAAAPPSREDAERYRSHEKRVRTLLADGLAAIRQALDETGRVSAAHGRYAGRGSPSPQLDTAPR